MIKGGLSGNVRGRFILALCAVLLSASALRAECRQALALAMDISGSVDAQEYRLQMDGLAQALDDPGVIDAFLTVQNSHVRLFIYEWAGLNTQRVILNWTDIKNEDDLAMAVASLRARTRQPREVATALGTAMKFGAEELYVQSDCWQLTLDISGDGESNIGPNPAEVKKSGEVARITINALAVGAAGSSTSYDETAELARLSSYFQSVIIQGPDAFVETASGYQDYQRAITKKLLREMNVIAVGSLR